eukprot:Gb_09736 [translate_table: standard]
MVYSTMFAVVIVIFVQQHVSGGHDTLVHEKSADVLSLKRVVRLLQDLHAEGIHHPHHVHRRPWPSSWTPLMGGKEVGTREWGKEVLETGGGRGREALWVGDGRGGGEGDRARRGEKEVGARGQGKGASGTREVGAGENRRELETRKGGGGLGMGEEEERDVLPMAISCHEQDL